MYLDYAYFTFDIELDVVVLRRHDRWRSRKQSKRGPGGCGALMFRVASGIVPAIRYLALTRYLGLPANPGLWRVAGNAGNSVENNYCRIKFEAVHS